MPEPFVIISVIATGYTFGFTVSCVVTPIFVRRVGHVRVFGALITLLTVSILLCALVVDWRAWMLFRGLAGFAIDLGNRRQAKALLPGSVLRMKVRKVGWARPLSSTVSSSPMRAACRCSRPPA